MQSWGTQTIEPIAQVILRPNETEIGKLPNEDSQSLDLRRQQSVPHQQVCRLGPGGGRRALECRQNEKCLTIRCYFYRAESL